MFSEFCYSLSPITGPSWYGFLLRVSPILSIEELMENFDPGDDLQVKYGSVPMAPFMFQDDILNVVEGLIQARIAKANT